MESSHEIAETTERQQRQEARGERLRTAVAMTKSLVEFMPNVMRTVEFRSRLVPPMSDTEIREVFQGLIDRANELQDAADAFMVFCRCQFPEESGDEQ